MATNDAFDFMTRLRRLQDLPACEALFAAVILPYGFDTFASGEVDLVDRARTVFHLIHWPQRWRDFYFSSGLIEGLVVPIGRAGNRVGLVSMVGSRGRLDDEAKAFLAVISHGLHAHVGALTARQGFAVPPAGLTDREIEAMRLVAKGRSDTAIAEAMGVAPSTAHEFVEKAKRRLNARSRAELAAIGVAMGIIDV
jgi:LuxR family quorum-sensing system transcriptional regulator CciR